MPLTALISDFTSYPINDVTFSDRIVAAKADILATLPSQVVYTPRNNYAEALPTDINGLADRLFNPQPFTFVMCLVYIIAPNSSIPFHIDGDRKIALNFPVDNAASLSFIHAASTPPSSEVSTVSLVLQNGDNVSYPIAEGFIPPSSTSVNCGLPIMVNIGKYHAVTNSSNNPAVIISFRIDSSEEQIVFDHFAAM